MLKKLTAGALLSLASLVTFASAALGCGYWDCTPLEGGDYCLCYGEC